MLVKVGGNRRGAVSISEYDLNAASGRKVKVGGRLYLMRCTMMMKRRILAKSIVPATMATFDKTMW